MEHSEVIQDLIDTLLNTHNGAGLAAQQIGANVNVFIARFDNEFGYEIFINPTLELSGKREMDEESCLSICDKKGKPKKYRKLRYHKCTVNYVNQHGENKTLKTAGFMARVIQHEYDHLQGILLAHNWS